QQPNHADALHLLGVIAYQKQKNEVAFELIGRAIAIDPSIAMYHNNLGNSLRAMGQLEQAAEAYRRAIHLQPDYAEAHNNLGNLYEQQKQIQEAIDQYRRAVELRPDFAPAHHNLGVALKQVGRIQEAVEEFLHAAKLNPECTQTYHHLANGLSDLGRFDQAIEVFHVLLNLKPDDAEARNDLGNVLRDQERIDEAVAEYYLALKFKPNLAEVHVNLGIALHNTNQFDRAVELKPDLILAHNNLGNALKDQGFIQEALNEYQTAMRIDPNQILAHNNYVYALYFHPDYNAEKIYEAHQYWSQIHAQPLKKYVQHHENNRDPDRKIRIGYVSGDFRRHVVGRNLLPLLREHDHSGFEIICYSNSFHADEVTEQLQRHADLWRNIANLPDQRTAEMIRDDRIDILVDLSLHTSGNRLLVFARKPAPIQVSYLGYPGSTGLPTMDYRFSDPYLDSPETDLNVYSEQTVHLAETYWCYRPADTAPKPIPPPVLSAGYITFGCLNNFAKVSNAALKMWAELPGAVENSRFVIHSPAGSHRDAVREVFIRKGIASDRVAFVGKQSWRDYINTYNRIDVTMDPFPYNGGITTCDSLFMGVPVVSLSGKTAVGRAGKSILTNVGLPELVAKTPEAYMDIAIKLAGDLPRLAELRKTLRERMENSPLMDAKRFARNVEAAYREMWRKWCAKT
ncbi:MAG TPA: tetratricopeptide repeat protein, partial [Phycisphaerae bacterium]|nr:tetratricopeptide repeat protein [Phycisphaerae bacterium]